MANMVDYLVWRGEFGFQAAPWNEVDALMMANLCYLDFRDIQNERGRTLEEALRMELVQETPVSCFEDRRHQFEVMAETLRFGGIRMHPFITLTDEKQELQFSATCYDLCRLSRQRRSIWRKRRNWTAGRSAWWGTARAETWRSMPRPAHPPPCRTG